MRLIAIILLVWFTRPALAQHMLPIPDTLSGMSFNLTVHRDSVQFFPGTITQTFGINAGSYLGPTLFLKKGDSVSVVVNNHAGDTTTMHWHGLHVAPQNDGGPFSMIMGGMSWNPRFTVRNRAATYWYHPHMMAKTAEQAIKGDVGMIIVRDNDEAALNLPRRYGTDDFPLIVQSVELDNQNQFMPKGMVDSIILVNGTDSPYTAMPAQVVRMRLLNASGERTFNFGFTGSAAFSVIANDNGLLPAPVSATRIWLSPGERAELLLDLSALTGDTIYLRSFASELPMGVQGGPTMPMPPWSPPMNSPLNGVDFNVLKIIVSAATTAPVTAIPSTLVADTPYTPAAANATRFIEMTADSFMVMDGPFYFNHNMFDMMRIDYRIPLNNTEIWTLHDSTMVAHPFHMHDVYFYILDRNGIPAAPVEAGRKDVVLIKSMETVRVIAKFEDFSDTTTPYMYHCHILMHEDDGMMGQFVVTTENTAVPGISSLNGLSVFPNPASDQFTIVTANVGDAQLIITNITGQTMYAGGFRIRTTISASGWPRGLYFITIAANGTFAHSKIIIE